ncbi:hypothetical protein KOR42_54670 [Thalassoglobus neptunius]|uniref:Uncharacterized protein n=1 Tax=Thalassoglobus neptunius TaxID=1938619 RepID=A0A5C5UWF8_9PLAN|nr:hypothetical protein KOR42_54670 [Thalassoglobus neptunius]
MSLRAVRIDSDATSNHTFVRDDLLVPSLVAHLNQNVQATFQQSNSTSVCVIYYDTEWHSELLETSDFSRFLRLRSLQHGCQSLARVGMARMPGRGWRKVIPARRSRMMLLSNFEHVEHRFEHNSTEIVKTNNSRGCSIRSKSDDEAPVAEVS